MCFFTKGIYTGDEKQTDVGCCEKNKALNRFKNIIPCEYLSSITMIHALIHQSGLKEFTKRFVSCSTTIGIIITLIVR